MTGQASFVIQYSYSGGALVRPDRVERVWRAWDRDWNLCFHGSDTEALTQYLAFKIISKCVFFYIVQCHTDSLFFMTISKDRLKNGAKRHIWPLSVALLS